MGEGQRSHRKIVVIGRTGDAMIVIAEGIASGDSIVTRRLFLIDALKATSTQRLAACARPEATQMIGVSSHGQSAQPDARCFLPRRDVIVCCWALVVENTADVMRVPTYLMCRRYR